MANFIYNAAAPPLIPTNLSIIQNPLPANGPGVELNTAVNLRNANWPEVPTGQVLPAGAMPGIFTVGQFQCMCIALAIFPNPAPPQWTQCHLAHVSHKNHAGIQNVINQLNAINHGQAYVVIGGKVSMKESMEFIRNRFLDSAFPPVQVWVYSAAEQMHFGFGIRSDGLFGQVT